MLNLRDFEKELSPIFEDELNRRYYIHNNNGLILGEIYECGCKVEYVYWHTSKSDYRPTDHKRGCPICDGWAAQMHGSANVYPCQDHMIKRN